MPPLLNSSDLYDKLLFIPKLNMSKSQSETERLMALDKIYDFYIPNSMTAEIYTKIYFAIYRSLKKKATIQATKQRNLNFNAIQLNSSSGIIGGCDAFTIIGPAGIGKTASIFHSVSLVTNNKLYEIDNPFIKVIPCLVIQTPFDCSIKSLLLEIIRQIDNTLHTNYYPKLIPTTDVLIGTVSQLCLNHVALLILDEIQNVIHHRAGTSLVHCITQIINSSGISICFSGTPECELFFSSTDYLARRTVGLFYGAMSYDSHFKDCCKYLWNYQPLINRTGITESDYEWLYLHSAGIIANIITLIHDAQELAIISGTEKLDKKMLNQVYCNRMINMHSHIEIQQATMPSSSTYNSKAAIKTSNTKISNDNVISLCVSKSKDTHSDIIDLLRKYISVTEVSI